MQSYITLNHHHIGQSHVLNGLSCEDYSASFINDQMAISVISDGHGDKNCFRSAEGAKIACEVAIQKCKKFNVSILDMKSVNDCDFNTMLHELEESIINQWKETVTLNAIDHPFTDKELEPLNENVQVIYRNYQRMEKAYGCTLIVAVITQNFWYGLQIGDGKCVAVYEDGIYVEPIPADEENCCGNRSTSLCNTKAIENFRHYFSDKKPMAVFVASDGVEESFDETGLHNCYFSVWHWAKNNGIAFANEQLQLLLPQISEGGSGDDVSVSGIINLEGNITKARQTLAEISLRVEASESQLERFDKLLCVSQEELIQKKEKHEKLLKDIDDVQKKLAELLETEKEFVTEVEALEYQISDIANKKQLAHEQVEKAHKYQENATIFWKTHLEELGIWKEKAVGDENW